MTAVRPSRTSSPERFASFSASVPDFRDQVFSELVRAARKPATWVPPSMVLMLLAKARTVSANPSLYWSATSTLVDPRPCARRRYRPAVEHVAASVEVTDVAGDAALEVEVLLGVDSLVAQAVPEALVPVGGLSRSLVLIVSQLKSSVSKISESGWK